MKIIILLLLALSVFMYADPRPEGSKSALEAKTQSAFNVKGYGAKGDGITDDTIAIQAALDAAAIVKGTVFLPNGVYRVNKTIQTVAAPNKHALRLQSGVSLIGESEAGVIIKPLDSCLSDTPVLYAYAGTSADITIERLTIDGNKTTRKLSGGGEDEGINLKASDNLRIINVTIKECGQDGIDLDDAIETYIEGCHIFNCFGNGIHCPGNTGNGRRNIMARVQISNCLIERCGFKRTYILNPSGGIDLVNAYDVLVSNCLFRDNAYEIYMKAGTLQVSNCHFHHTREEDHGGGMASYDALRVYGESALINNSYFEWNKGRAIHCEKESGGGNTGRTIISNNSFKCNLNSLTGIELTNAQRTSISNNSFTCCKYAVKPTCTDYPLIVSGNQFLSNVVTGLRVGSSIKGICSNNVFTGGTAILMESGASDWIVSANVFESTTSFRCDSGASNHQVFNNKGGKYLIKSGSHVFKHNEIEQMHIITLSASTWESNIINSVDAASNPYLSNQIYLNNSGKGMDELVQGSATLVAGSVTVNTLAANSSQKIRVWRETQAGSAVGHITVGTITNGKGFVVNSLNSSGSLEVDDTSTISWAFIK